MILTQRHGVLSLVLRVGVEHTLSNHAPAIRSATSIQIHGCSAEQCHSWFVFCYGSENCKFCYWSVKQKY